MPVFAYTKLKPLRQSKGLNQAEIAAELGISRPTYVLMEQGEKEPTLSQLYTLSRLLGVNAGELCINLPARSEAVADYGKFKDLVMACITYGADGGTTTKTKLAILSYLADFAWYNANGRAITGATYRCSSRGPSADDYFRAVDELYEEQAIALEPRGKAMLVRPVEQRAPKNLNEKELSLIQEICQKWRPESTDSIVTFAMDQAPCKLAKPGDPIAYEAILNEPKETLY